MLRRAGSLPERAPGSRTERATAQCRLSFSHDLRPGTSACAIREQGLHEPAHVQRRVTDFRERRALEIEFTTDEEHDVRDDDPTKEMP